jgi:tellurite resistance protein
MIIFGTRGITTTPETGNFFCPQCNGQTPYQLKRVRRFFTLYFIPLIPLDKVGEYIECPRCQGTFDIGILDYDPSLEGAKFEALFFVAVKQVMIGMLLADGHIDDNEVLMLQSQFQQLTGAEVTEQDLREEIAEIQKSGTNPLELVGGLASGLNATGKETVIRAAYAIANADGNFDPSEVALLQQIGQSLDLTTAHLNGILQELATGDGTQLPGAQTPPAIGSSDGQV